MEPPTTQNYNHFVFIFPFVCLVLPPPVVKKLKNYSIIIILFLQYTFFCSNFAPDLICKVRNPLSI